MVEARATYFQYFLTLLKKKRYEECFYSGTKFFSIDKTRNTYKKII